MFNRSPTEPPPLKVRKTTHVGPGYTAHRPIYAPQTSGHSRVNWQSTLADDGQQPSPSTRNETASQPYVGSDATGSDTRGSGSRPSSFRGSNEGQVASGSTGARENVAYNAHKCEEELIYFPKYDEYAKRDTAALLKGKTGVPPLTVPTASLPSPPPAMRVPTVPRPSVPMSSVTTPMAHYEMSGEDWFNLMNPWAKYSVELNRPPNRPRSPPVVYDEPTPEISDYEDSSEEEYNDDAMDTDEESEMEVEEERTDEDGMRGVKRVREDGSDVDDPRHKKVPRV